MAGHIGGAADIERVGGETTRQPFAIFSAVRVRLKVPSALVVAIDSQRPVALPTISFAVKLATGCYEVRSKTWPITLLSV